MKDTMEGRLTSGTWREFVVEGHFDLIKGFVVGFLEGKGMRGAAIFAREHQVKHDTEVKHFLRSLTGHEDRVRVLVHESVCQPLEDALADIQEALSLKLVSVREVAGAEFGFAYEAYTRELGEELKGLFANLPGGVSIADYEMEEKVDPEGKGIEAYAPLHEYEIKATGRITGAVKAVIDLHARLEQQPLVAPEGILLQFR
jgi:hypothetical protein